MSAYVCKYVCFLLSMPLKERLFRSPVLMWDFGSEGLTVFHVFEQSHVKLWFCQPDELLTFYWSLTTLQDAARNERRKSLMVQLTRLHKFPSPVTPLIPEGDGAKPHIILFLFSPSRPTFHYTSPIHPTRTCIATSEISLCASLEAAVGEFTSSSVSLKCIPSLAIRWLDTGDLCRSSARGAHTRVHVPSH